MRTVNKVILVGNVTRDPIVKTTENGKKIALFTIATNRYYKTNDGESRSEAEFHNCVAWGWLADRVEASLQKWKLIYIEGRLKTRVIEKDDGEKLYKTEVVTMNLIFLNKKSDFEDTSSASASSPEVNTLTLDDDDDLF